jgi:beta-phosphoglucomutase-like phosphatase (HAD superfamily)
MALDGMIFDLDGTLVDSNAAHVEAWGRAFARHGFKVAPDRIFIEIGKGGDKVVPHLLGKEADEKDGKALRAAQPEPATRPLMPKSTRSHGRRGEYLRRRATRSRSPRWNRASRAWERR